MKFRFWFDEADQTVVSKRAVKIVNKIRKYKDIVEEVVFITATPQDKNGGLISIYGELTIHPLEIPTDRTTYLQWKEIEKEIVEQDNSQHLKHYVKKCLIKKPLKNGDLLFVPAGTTKKSHNQISEMLIKENLADKVFVINGDDKEIQLRTKDGYHGYCCIKDDLSNTEFSKYLEKNCYDTSLKMMTRKIV